MSKSSTNGQYEVYVEEGGEHRSVIRTGSRTKAVAAVADALNRGFDETDIYAEYCGSNFAQAGAHLLLPRQQ